MVEKMEEITEIVNQLNVQIKHIFREANQLVDFITNTTINQDSIDQFHSFIQMLRTGRKILNMDKIQIPTLRVSARRINSNHNNLA